LLEQAQAEVDTRWQMYQYLAKRDILWTLALILVINRPCSKGTAMLCPYCMVYLPENM
jgi:hypothetical protein